MISCKVDTLGFKINLRVCTHLLVIGVASESVFAIAPEMDAEIMQSESDLV